MSTAALAGRSAAAAAFGARLSPLHGDPQRARRLAPELLAAPTALRALPAAAQGLAPVSMPAPAAGWYEEMVASSTLKKRRLKMNKHKTRKRRKRDRNRSK